MNASLFMRYTLCRTIIFRTGPLFHDDSVVVADKVFMRLKKERNKGTKKGNWTDRQTDGRKESQLFSPRWIIRVINIIMTSVGRSVRYVERNRNSNKGKGGR